MQDSIKVRIQNDGRPAWATKITDAVTGLPIDNVTGFSWAVDLNATKWGSPEVQQGYASITVFEPIVDIIVDAEIKKICACCGRAIEGKE